MASAPLTVQESAAALEWEPCADRHGNVESYEAVTPFGRYEIEHDPFSYAPTPAYYVRFYGAEFAAQTATPHDAMAAAQSDFNQRLSNIRGDA